MGVLEKPRIKPTAAELFGPGGYRPSADGEFAFRTSHAAASHSDPAMVGWYPAEQSADADLIDELPLMRARVTDEERNNGYIHAANQTFKDSIVGHQLRVNPAPVLALLGWTPEQGEAWSRSTRAQFESWGNVAVEVDATKEQNLRGLTIQALGSWFLTGDAYALPLWRPRSGCKWNTRLQLIESNRVEEPPFFKSSSRTMHGGWEIDRDGAKVAVWVRKTAIGDERFRTVNSPIDVNQYRRVPAFYPWGRRRVLHLYDKERPGQSVGKPIVTRIIRELRMLNHYTRTELQATVANSLVAAVLESNLDPETAQSLFKSGGDRETYWNESIRSFRGRTTLKPGATLALPLGAKFSGFTPNRPNPGFDKYVMAVLHNIGAGLNIPYELLTKDFTQTNYSSARAAMLEAWRHFYAMRAWLEEMWLDPIYELWLEEAINALFVEAAGFYDNRYAYSWTRNWSMVGRGWVDPLKEASGVEKRIASGVSSIPRECEEQGLDWMEMLDDAKRVQDYAAELQINVPSGTAPVAPGAAVNTAEPEDEDEDEDDEEDQEDKIPEEET